MAAGRPTSYKPEYCRSIIDFCSKGDSIVAFAVSIGVHRDTIYEWAKQHKEFSDSLLMAKDAYQVFYERLLKACIMGQRINKEKIDAYSLQFKMKARFSDYHDTQVIKSDTAQPITLAYKPKAKRKFQDMNGNDVPGKQLDSDVQ